MKIGAGTLSAMKICAVVVGGGAGRRMGGRRPKALLALGGRPLFLHSVETFGRMKEVGQVVPVLPADRIGAVARRWGRRLARAKVRRLVAGGATRHASVRAGVAAADPSCGLILIHDAARPFVSVGLIRRVAAAAAKTGAALPALRPAETVKLMNGGRLRTLDRRRVLLAQTPQGFRSDNLRGALARLRAADWTDDVQLLERLGRAVAVVEGEPTNVKITYPGELARARLALK
jgi:2-C-methyl-D-erythritol 4-phosphate cytidylyltransferase